MKTILVFYDNWCPNCIKFVKFVEKFNWFHLIEFKHLRNNLVILEYPSLNFDLAKQQIASFSLKWFYGYDSIYYIFKRLPIFWIFIPFLFLLKVSKVGSFLYIQLAVRRSIIPLHCDSNNCDF